ncbi:hypothetical protein JZU71_00610, partial [bacterium]|nr:hypothetical protein [bacterium]
AANTPWYKGSISFPPPKIKPITLPVKGHREVDGESFPDDNQSLVRVLFPAPGEKSLSATKV